jgi:hypothetical protein
MQYQVVTGPLYEKAAKRMMKYRQIAARIPNAKPNTAVLGFALGIRAAI